MATDCYGPHPVHASKAYLRKIESDPHFQFEMFTVLEQDIWTGEGFDHQTYYHFFPYNYAIDYVESYEKAL